jgi:hypothetical protein
MDRKSPDLSIGARSLHDLIRQRRLPVRRPWHRQILAFQACDYGYS